LHTQRLYIHYRIVVTVYVHVVPEKRISRKDILICVKEATRHRIVITAGYIIESSLRVIIIPTVADGVQSTDAINIYCNSAIAPSVVGVFSFDVSRRIIDSGNIALQILLIVVVCAPP